MTILADLTDKMKLAMKAHDQVRLDAIRMMISSIKYALVDKPEMSEEDVVAVLTKEAKKRRESVEAYKAGGRQELADREQFELNLIEEYLPKMMSEDEVRQVVSSKLQDKEGIGIGEAMKIVLAELKGKADGGVIARVVKDTLQGENL